MRRVGECTRDPRSRVHSEEEREENPEFILDFLNRRRALSEAKFPDRGSIEKIVVCKTELDRSHRLRFMV